MVHISLYKVIPLQRFYSVKMLTVCRRGKCTEDIAFFSSSCGRFKAYYLDIEKNYDRYDNLRNLKHVCEVAGIKLEQIFCFNNIPVKASIIVAFLVTVRDKKIKIQKDFETNTELLILGDILNEKNKECYVKRCLEALNHNLNNHDFDEIQFMNGILLTEKYIPMDSGGD